MHMLDFDLLQPTACKTVCVYFSQSETNTGAAVKTLIERIFRDVVGVNVYDIVRSSIQDQAAGNIATHMELERITCLMHVINKLFGYAGGLVVRTRKKQPINEFKECVKIFKLAREITKFFTYSQQKRGWLKAACEREGVPFLIPTLDKCATRIGAPHRMMAQLLRLRKPLLYFQTWCELHKIDLTPVVQDADDDDNEFR